MNNKIIVMFENKDKELSISVYQFLDELYRYISPSIICHVTPEEYCIMKEQIASLGGLKERFTSDQLGYDSSRYFITPAYQDDKKILISNYDFPEKKGSYFLENGILSYNEDEYQVTNHPILSKYIRDNSHWKYKIYTTESYKDVVEHYSNNKKVL